MASRNWICRVEYSAATPERPVRLTGRELEVLRMLAAGRSNHAIARELVVTLDSVKKHVGYVLGKLGAASHTESVPRARVLNLIPTTAWQQRPARLHLGARYSPEDSTRHVPFRGTPGPPDLPSVRRTERTPEGGSAMATVKPGPSNGSTALTRTATAPAN